MTELEMEIQNESGNETISEQNKRQKGRNIKPFFIGGMVVLLLFAAGIVYLMMGGGLFQEEPIVGEWRIVKIGDAFIPKNYDAYAKFQANGNWTIRISGETMAGKWAFDSVEDGGRFYTLSREFVSDLWGLACVKNSLLVIHNGDMGLILER